MKKSQLTCLVIAALALLPAINTFAETPPETTAAKPVYGEYQDWSLLSVSHRLDKKTLRAILGNAAAITAARQDKTTPWPDGVILAKVVWNEKNHANWSQAIVPDTFGKAEAMIKDSKKYAATGGWGFGFWEGKKLVMYEEAKAKECFACHLPMKDKDYVYTSSALQ